MAAFIVAEAGVNHLGDRNKMLALCDAAKRAGADAVKFQAYDTVPLMLRRRQITKVENGYQEMSINHLDTYKLLTRCQLADADLDAIAAQCKAIGLKWFASVFDPSQVERVLSRGACALKIGHAENEYDELFDTCVAAHKAHKLSDGFWISGRPEDTNTTGVNVLCTEEYPAASPPALHWINPESRKYGFKGFSSHYADYRIPAAAALRGAEYVEAHLKLSDADPEAAWSLSPEDFGKMVKLIRQYETWL